MVYPKMEKNVLMKRLKEGIRKNVYLLFDRPVKEIENCIGDSFNAGDYLQPSEATGSPLDKSIMKVDIISTYSQ